MKVFYGRITLQRVFYFAGLAVYITLGVAVGTPRRLPQSQLVCLSKENNVTYHCPYCQSAVRFPELDTSMDLSIADLQSQRMQKVAEKPVRCANPICAKYVVKSECEQKP